MELLEKLNPMQKKACTCIEGPLLLLAGAGSGKTRVLVHRIAYLIEKGVSPFNILAITFTNKAAKEMRERINTMLPIEDSAWVSTFHSMCVRILRREIDKISYSNQFTIYDTSDSERLIKNILKELNINDKQYPAKSCIAAISEWKNELFTPEAAERASEGNFRKSQIAKIYAAYQKKLRDCNALDFDDIIFKTVELFTTREDVAQKFQQRFQYVMVDEYQDTNTAQYRLIRLLSEKHKNLCVVGDDDQSIYGWRGANIRNILDFEKDFKNATVIRLEQNYRSTKNILEAANEVVKNNISRKPKALWTENEQGNNITFYKAIDDLEEADYVANRISSKVLGGLDYKDFAILYRTNAQSRTIEDQFMKKNIPYRILGGIRFYERKEVKDILAYLRFIHNPQDLLAFMRIINVPKRGIGDSSVEKVLNYAQDNSIGFFNALYELEHIAGLGARAKKLEDFRKLLEELLEFSKANDAFELVCKLLDDCGYIQELKQEGTEEALDRVNNVMELVTKAAVFIESNEDTSLAAFLEDVALVADVDAYKEDENAVVLLTLHSSKGLEFPNVFLVGFEDGIFPSYRSITSGDEHDLEEERRLCYVGITRAKENLHLVAASSRMQFGQTNYNPISRFYKEIPKKLVTDEKGFSIGNHLPSKEEKSTQEERKGISQFSELAKAKNRMDTNFGAKNYQSYESIPKPKNVSLDFEVGDKVKQLRYGVGTVINISPAGADYEVSVDFENVGIKKFMAHLSKLKKV